MNFAIVFLNVYNFDIEKRGMDVSKNGEAHKMIAKRAFL